MPQTKWFPEPLCRACCYCWPLFFFFLLPPFVLAAGPPPKAPHTHNNKKEAEQQKNEKKFPTPFLFDVYIRCRHETKPHTIPFTVVLFFFCVTQHTQLDRIDQLLVPL